MVNVWLAKTPWNMKHDLRSQTVDAILAQDPLKKPEIPLKKREALRAPLKFPASLHDKVRLSSMACGEEATSPPYPP